MKNEHNPEFEAMERRSFLKAAALAAGAVWAGGCATGGGKGSVTTQEPSSHDLAMKSLIAPGDVILFQGDSITDAGRSRPAADQPNQQAALGHGYAWLAASQLLVDRPGDNLTIYNRGISGNKVFQLADRWQKDCLDLKPNLLSILIGVNDIWHGLNGQYDGTVETYERDYRALVERTLEALPGIKLVLCEPFVLRCGAVNDKWFPLFDEYRAAARRVAGSFKTVFVPFQSMFDAAVKFAPPEHWAKDGVHPSSAGAALMAHEWIKHVIHPGMG